MRTRCALGFLLVLLSCLPILLNAQSQTAAASEPSAAGKKQFTIDDMAMPGGLLGRGPESVKWSPDGSKVSYIQHDQNGGAGALYYVDVATGTPAVLVAGEKLSRLTTPMSAVKSERQQEAMQRYGVSAYHWSPDSKKLLFDSLGQLWLYTLDSGVGVQLTSTADQSIDPKFSPDGEKIAYVRKHNLYVRQIKGNDEKELTKDTDENLLNGEVDWVYEEELYVRSNYFWSPSGKQIAFLQMNETTVPTYPIVDWLPTHPTVDQEKYPKAGDPNPMVRIGIVGANGGKIKWLSAGGSGSTVALGNDPDSLIPRFGWVRDGLLWAMALNRVQNRMDLYFIDTDNGKWKLMMTETSEAWIDMGELGGSGPDTDFQMLSSGDRFLWRSWRDGHYHIYLYQFDKQNPLTSEAKLVAQLTHGDWEVESLSGVDDKQGIVYFTGNEGDWRQCNVYSVGLDGKNFHRISKENGTHSAMLDPANAKYYVDDYSALTVTPTMSLCTTDGGCKTFWRSHSLEPYTLLTPQFVDFTAADGTTTLQGVILLPTGGPMMANGKVPLINNPYGGPGAQTVRDAWGTVSFFDQALAQQGFAILHVDNRGMANRGKAFAMPIKYKFGQNEYADQMAAIKQALEKFPQLDGSRLGWWGWSYGGFFTIYTLEHTDMFKGGVAGGPVTDWHNYDTIYTERYMGLPKDHDEAYHNSSPVNFAADLHGSLLEIHGTSDDNVHLQNTIQMVNALVNEGKQFRLMVYPRQTHGVGGKARIQMMHMIDDHFEQILGPAK